MLIFSTDSLRIQLHLIFLSKKKVFYSAVLNGKQNIDKSSIFFITMLHEINQTIQKCILKKQRVPSIFQLFCSLIDSGYNRMGIQERM